jgi:hypothetical protein
VVGEAFTVTSGTNCELAENGNCVQTSGYSTLEYFEDETCTITVNNPGKIDVVGFDVESDAGCGYDYLTVQEKDYCGSVGPDGVTIDQGDEIGWTSDSGTVGAGFKICHREVFLCTITNGTFPNVKDCTCGNNECGLSTGLFCSEEISRCDREQILSVCSVQNGISPNIEACACGVRDCNVTTGLYCSSALNHCHKTPPCGNHVGHVINADECSCGTSTCNSISGLFCSVSTSQCFKKAATVIVTTGDDTCEISGYGTCFQSKNYPSTYEGSKACKIEFLKSGILTVVGFDIETHPNCEYDFFKLHDQSYCGTTGPSDTVVQKGTIAEWKSDAGIGSGPGFKICILAECTFPNGNISNTKHCACGVNDCQAGSYCICDINRCSNKLPLTMCLA